MNSETAHVSHWHTSVSYSTHFGPKRADGYCLPVCSREPFAVAFTFSDEPYGPVDECPACRTKVREYWESRVGLA